jgi:SIR2-like domain
MFLLGSGASFGLSSGDGKLSAPSMADLWNTASSLKGFDEAVVLVGKEVADRKDIETLLSAVQSSLSLAASETLEKFLRASEQAIAKRCRFVDSGTKLPAHETLLRRIAGRSSRLLRPQIFTTNYDLAVEEAASRTNFKLIDGFELRENGRFDGANFDLDFVRRRPGEPPQLESSVGQLMKIHGSVDWDQSDGVLRKSANPETPCLIYPAQDKFRLSYDPPSLECLARFQMSLREREVALVVAGFGFNDAHIAAPIRAAIQANVGLQLVVVSPTCDASDNEEIAFTRELATAGDTRITLFACGFNTFVRSLPDINGRDEREAHEERLANVRASIHRA